MPQATVETSLNRLSASSANASSLLSSWPQIPRQSYALEPIDQRPAASRITSTNSRVALDERASWYAGHDGSSTPTQTHSFARYQRSLHLPSGQQHLHTSSSLATQADNQGDRLSRHNTVTQRASQTPSQTTRETQHKVYLLNCKHCGNFLSDRGMKAVLLLKPNITLYSTDIVPTTCGPYFTPSAFHGGLDPSEPMVERTCECLTQTLGCYGCGAQVGYNIISPCIRCTDSVMKHQRSSNGHRTVLHCSEISVRERRFVCGEPGVRAAKPVVLSERLRQVYLEQTRNRATNAGVNPLSNPVQQDLYTRRHAQAASEEDDLEAEKLDANMAFYQQQYERQQSSSGSFHERPERSNTQARSLEYQAGPRNLRRGDVLFWSDLVAGGERAQPFDPDPILERPVACR